MVYRTRDLFVRQRTQTINALRAHLAEQGIVAPKCPAHIGRLAGIINGDEGTLPVEVRELARLLLDQIADYAEKITDLDAKLRQRATSDDMARRLTTIPGVGPITAAAMVLSQTFRVFVDLSRVHCVMGQFGSDGRFRIDG